MTIRTNYKGQSHDRPVQKALFAFTMIICLALMLLSNTTPIQQSTTLESSHIQKTDMVENASLSQDRILSEGGFSVSASERGYGASYVSLESLRP